MKSFIAIAKDFTGTSEQVQAVRWFQASTGVDRQRHFATQWRDGIDSGVSIDFVNVFDHWANLPHQNAALGWLERTSQPATIAEFNRLWKRSESKKPIVLNVPFFMQTDNLYEPSRTCNTSCCAMVAKFLGAKISGDDAYYQIVRKYGDTTDHGAQTKALNEIGVKSTWHTNLGFADLDKSLESGLPIVIGILHRGTLRNPTGGGHMIVVIGKDDDRGGYVCHDPFGNLLDNYTSDPRNGNAVLYPRSVLNRRWTVAHPKDGWGRLFRAS